MSREAILVTYAQNAEFTCREPKPDYPKRSVES